MLCGDSEMAEGSIWEAFDHAAYEELDNLIAIIDVNRLGQRGETMLGWDPGGYGERAEAFGWRALEIDGHDVEEIDARLRGGAEPATAGRSRSSRARSRARESPRWRTATASTASRSRIPRPRSPSSAGCAS